MGFLICCSSQAQETVSLTVDIKDIRNLEGQIQFTLYNKEGSIPDEKFENFYKIAKAKISNNTSTVTFSDLPKGNYAVSILHDENNDGRMKMGLIFPKEGIGFTNYKSFGLNNKPNFLKASIDLQQNTSIEVPVVYF